MLVVGSWWRVVEDWEGGRFCRRKTKRVAIPAAAKVRRAVSFVAKASPAAMPNRSAQVVFLKV